MKNGIITEREQIESALEAADMAWWSLELPSGAMSFSPNKTAMLGYEAEDFIHYLHFTELIHPDDHDATMEAMRDHYTGKKPTYETVYRIKASDGTYVTFRDQGKIVERLNDSFTVAGIVMKVADAQA